MMKMICKYPEKLEDIDFNDLRGFEDAMTDGDGGDGGDGGGILQASIPAAGGEEADPSKPKEGEWAIPETYVNEGWTKDLKSDEDVWKKLAGAESLIGKQIKIPNAETSVEDRDKFFDQIKPEKSEEYKFNRDGQSEEMKAMADENLDNAVKDLFHKAKLAPWQAELIQTGYENDILKGALEQSVAQKVENDRQFDELAKKTFGDNEDKIMETANKLIEAHTPEGFKDQLKGLPNEQLMAVAGLLNEIQKTYINEDTLNTLGDSISADGEATLFERGKKLMESTEYQNEFDPKHQKTKDQVDEIFRKLGNIKK